MSIDPKIAEAIEEAVAQTNQSKALSQKIIAWTEAIMSGNESVQDAQSAQRRLDPLYETVQTSGNVSNSDSFSDDEGELI